MPKAIEINKHKFFKLGKKEAKRDKRNLKFAAVVKAPVHCPTGTTSTTSIRDSDADVRQ